MKGKIWTLLPALLLATVLPAQVKRPAVIKPDLGKMMQMNPAELEKYKQKMLKDASVQAKAIASANDFKIDETLLPDFEIKQPPKDLRRLAMVPLQVPSRADLMAGVQQSLKQVLAVTTPAAKQEVEKIVSEQSSDELQKSSVGFWYGDKPLQALLVSLTAVQKNPNEVIPWNNLAALYNMAGLEEKAIPILMHHLQSLPENSLLLNNIGQSFLGLGDMNRAEQFLQHCLAIDPDNPEANRSMGMINLFRKEYTKAQQYFEKELQVAHRRSTIALMKKKGMPLNLYALRKKRTGVPHRDFFEEIGLGKYVMPDFPEESGMKDEWDSKNAFFYQSLIAEDYFWSSAFPIKAEAVKAEGKRAPNLYADLEDELTRGLGDTYIPLLGLLSDEDNALLSDMIREYYAQLEAIKCPPPPAGPDVGADVILAYQKKCCAAKKAIADAYVAKRNQFIRNRFILVNSRWKEYINGMISNVMLNITEGNKRMVAYTVAGYFSFLIQTLQVAVSFEPAPGECFSNTLTNEQADSIIKVSHTIDFNCPSWLNLSINLGVASLKASCSSYAIEGGEGLLAGYEKNFKTGTSTFSAGAGVSQNFAGITKGELKQMIFVSYDNNNQFSDFGLKGTASVTAGIASEQLITDGIGKISSTLAGVEGGYTLSLNSGFKPFIGGKGLLSGVIK